MLRLNTLTTARRRVHYLKLNTGLNDLHLHLTLHRPRYLWIFTVVVPQLAECVARKAGCSFRLALQVDLNMQGNHITKKAASELSF